MAQKVSYLKDIDFLCSGTRHCEALQRRVFVWSDTPSHKRLCVAVWLPSHPVIWFLSDDIKKTSSELTADRWVIEELTADDRQEKKKKANPQNYREPRRRLLCRSCFFFSLSTTCLLAWGLSGVSGPGVTHHEPSCWHQVVPLITGLL